MTLAAQPPVIPGAFPEPSIVETDLRRRGSAYLSLTKPRIAVLVLITVAIGYGLGTQGTFSMLKLALTVIGTGLVAGGASVWNQILERDRDALMKRTAGRPLPTGRVSLAEALVFGSVLVLLGLAILALGVNLLATSIAAVTFVLYVGVYTPLKPITTLNTVDRGDSRAPCRR